MRYYDADLQEEMNRAKARILELESMRKPNTEVDIETEVKLQEIKDLHDMKPYIRSAAAFLLYVFRGNELSVGECYRDANVFLSRLTVDVKGEDV